ncbi:MAG TPA: MmcQ/YjbR family DNA-binding protein [Ilumatobacteraceae bacterium]|jgi:hypothetical protein
MAGRHVSDVADEIVDALREICARLPECVEETAWVGTRWRIRGRTFAHVLTVDAGWPPAYASAIGEPGPITLLMFRSAGDELDVLRNSGRPFFAPPWRDDEVGMILDDVSVDWDEIGELVTESYCAQAPLRLARTVAARPDEPPS